MSYPWMQSKYTDKPVVCSICGQWIAVGEPRRYHQQSKVSAHDACVGAQEMKDHMATEQFARVAPPQASPERESREAAIERMHGENFDAAKAIGEAVRSLKASVVETNMILSVIAECMTKGR